MKQRGHTHQRSFLRGRGLRIGRIWGIEIVADWSLLIIFFLVAFSLGLGGFPRWHPEWSQALVWGAAFTSSVLLLASVLVHELAHSVVGRRFGIPVHRVTLFVFGGMAHMEDEAPTPKAEFFMAAVGPAVSLAIGFGAIFWGALLVPADLDPEAAAEPGALIGKLGLVATLLLWIGPVNVALGVFNLLPGFPLDGGRVLRAILWSTTKSLRRATRLAAGSGQLLGLMMIGTGLAMAVGIRVPLFGAGFAGGIWLVLIGWFLASAARSSYQQVLVREALGGVSVGQMMKTNVEGVPHGLSVDAFVHDYLSASRDQELPVLRGGELLGTVSLQDLKDLPREKWRQTHVDEVMEPPEEAIVDPDKEATEALAEMARHQRDQLYVVRQGRVQGLIHRNDIARWLMEHRRSD